jgi:hypothetical protein
MTASRSNRWAYQGCRHLTCLSFFPGIIRELLPEETCHDQNCPVIHKQLASINANAMIKQRELRENPHCCSGSVDCSCCGWRSADCQIHC